MPSIKILETPHTYELTAPVADSKLPVLVFVHGWLLSRHYWHPLVQLLKAKYQCLIYDARGFGESQIADHSRDNNSDLTSEIANSDIFSGLSTDNLVNENNSPDYSLYSYAKDLRCLLSKLNIERAWLVGHSLGGSIALWTADIHPDIVEGVICLNAGGGIYLKEEFERFRNVGQRLVKFRPRWLSLIPLVDLLFTRMMVARPLRIKWGRRRVIDFIEADEQAALGALLESTTEHEVHLLPQLVSRLKQPAYFIAGDKDQVMETKYVNHLASFHHLFNSPESNVFQIHNCGHLGMIEAPDEVSTIINQILDKHLDRVEE
ncbi:MAG: alpha/beta hydrolase [Cyanobacteria bacterium P01_G01_bin.39]